MSNYKLFALVLISMGGICILSGNLFLVLLGIFMAAIGVYTAINGSKEKKYDRIKAYSHKEDENTESDLVHEKLPIDEEEVETVGVEDRHKSEYVDDDAGEEKVYKTMGEMPPEVRRRFEQTERQAKKSPDTDDTQKSFTWTDDNGVERTYNSLDEMPPEARKKFEQSPDSYKSE